MVDRPRLTPEQVAGRSFPTSFRGFEQSEVRAFLATVAEDLRAARTAGELAAADVIARAEARAADLLAEAQDEARRVRSTIEAERERAFAEGAARADELVSEAERVRGTAESDGEAEAERLIAEAKAVRERILGDLARRRATLREQVEQLHAARERLLGALADLRTQVEEAAGDLRGALPEAKVAADAAARRVAAEALPTIEELEGEIAAFRAAGLDVALGERASTDDEPAVVDGPVPDPTPDPTAAPEPEPAPETGVEVEPDASASNGTGEAASSMGDAPAERRSAAVRVFRTRRDPTPALGLHETELHEVDPAAPFEEVRLVTAEDAAGGDVPEEGESLAADEPVDATVEPPDDDSPEAVDAPDEPPEAVDAPAEPATAEAIVPEAVGPPVAAGAPPPPEAIDELFARLKAGREERKATADAVLAPTPSPPAAEPAAPSEGAAVATPAAPVAVAATPAVGDRDAQELARRDAALAVARDALAKRLKRQLADEQNEVLDGLRRGETRAFVLADADDHAAGWSLAAARDLAAAADIGAAFDGGIGAGPISATEVATVAGVLADSFARPLRTKVLEAIDAADGDRDVAADAVRSIYRDRRGRRLEEVVEHAVLDAFSTGVLAASPVGAEFVWVVDDGGTQCPDCDDNALAGATTGGSPFPTGDVRPPAHPGCRCLLVRARAR